MYVSCRCTIYPVSFPCILGLTTCEKQSILPEEARKTNPFLVEKKEQYILLETAMTWESFGPYAIASVALIGVLITAATVIFYAGKLTERVDSMKEGLGELKDAVDSAVSELRGDIKGILQQLGKSTTTSNSPITLTELGQSISREIGASGWAESEAKKLLSDIQEKEPYEIQILSFEHAKKAVLSPELQRRILQSAYDNGITEENVKDVLGVELRDALLRLRGSN